MQKNSPVSQAADYAHADRGRNLSNLHGNSFRPVVPSTI